MIHKAQRTVANDGRMVAEIADYENAWEGFNAGMTALYGLRTREEIIAVVAAAERLGVPPSIRHPTIRRHRRPPASN